METRLLPLPHLRFSETTEGQFDGIAVPWDTAIRVGGITEVIARGAVDPASMVGLPILWQHDTGQVAGVVRSASSVRQGIHVTGQFIDTVVGRDARVAVQEGAVSGLSIGFEPEEQTVEGNTITRTRIGVRELSLATLPAYDNARVTAVRHQEEASVPETTPVQAPPTPAYITRADLEALEARMTTHTPAPVRTLGVVEAFVAQIADGQANRHLRALADVVSTSNSGVTPPNWLREVVSYIDSQRYMFAAVGSVPFPTTGLSLTVPKVVTHTLVGPRGTEKTEIPSRALTTNLDNYPAKWFAGGVDVALEIIWQSDPSIWDLVVQDILANYAQVTDDALTADVETAGTPTGAVLDFTDWSTLSGQIITEAEAIRAVSGQFGDRLSLTTASWASLVGMMDADGRRLFAPGGATNSDGTAPLLSRSINVGGVQAFHNPWAAEDVLFNQRTARAGERPPASLVSDNVALMGRDFGVLGGYVFVPRANGIRTFSVAVAAAAAKK